VKSIYDDASYRIIYVASHMRPFSIGVISNWTAVSSSKMSLLFASLGSRRSAMHSVPLSA